MSIDSRINPPKFVYHYTDGTGIAGILADGIIRASPTPLYSDLAFTQQIRLTKPIVWLSINPIMETTTMVKNLVSPTTSATPEIFRVVIPYGYAGDLGLGEYTEAEKIPHSDWAWNIRTAQAVGSNYTTWRICPRDTDIPRSDWLGVERFTGIDEDG